LLWGVTPTQASTTPEAFAPFGTAEDLDDIDGEEGTVECLCERDVTGVVGADVGSQFERSNHQ
jgi:hypothetical protein